MPLFRDIEEIIIFLLSRKVSTLVNKYYRDRYFQKNGIKLRTTERLKNGENILRKYNMIIKLLHIEKFDTEDISTDILDNIVSLDLRHNTQQDFSGVKTLKNLKILKFHYDGPISLAGISFDTMIHIDVNAWNLDNYLVELVKIRNPTIGITSVKDGKLDILKPISDNIISIATRFPILNIQLPNLEKIVTYKRILRNSNVLFPKLRKISYFNIESYLEDELSIYKNIKKSYLHLEWCNVVRNISFETYIGIRKYKSKKHQVIHIEHQFLEKLLLLEGKYRSENPYAKKIKLRVAQYSLINYLYGYKYDNYKKLTEYFDVVWF